MINMLTAFTEEIDDPKVAVSEILEQLKLNENLRTNSIGILHCSCDFDESDAMREICRHLPFDVVGCTSLSVQTPGIKSQLALILTVLTSDEIRFVSGVSAPIENDLNVPVAEIYRKVIGCLAERPAMLMPFIPFMTTIGGDEFIDKLNALSEGKIPAFGTVAITSEPDFSREYTIYNGAFYPASLVLLGFVGDFSPRFFSASVSEKNILKQKAVVTEVNRNVLKTVNNIRAMDYLESIGLSIDGSVSGFGAMPIVIKLEDGSVLTRACVTTTPDGGIVLCGSVPVGSTLAIATMGAADIVESTGEKVKEALRENNVRGMMIYSCVARNWVLGTKVMAEHDAVEACVGNSAPYHFVYSGGEVFPSFLEDGKISNHLQNDTMILCVL
jgi:hypothetical protein